MTSKRRNAAVAGGVAAALALPAILVGTPAMADETAPVEDPTVAAQDSEVSADTSDATEAAAGDAVGSTAEETPATSAAPAAETAVVESVDVPVPVAEDTTAPVIASVTPGDGAFVSGTTTFAVDVVEPNVSYSYIEFHQNGRWLTDATKEPGSQIHGNSPQLVLDTTRFPDGVYGLKITSTDKAGNSTIKTTSVVVDNTKPVLSSNLTDGQWVSKKQDVVLTVTEANPLAYHAQLYGPDGTAVDAVKAYAYAPTTPTLTIPAVNWSNLPEGDYRMVFSARDKSGNATSLSVGLRHDETRPSLELTGDDVVRPSEPGSVDFSAVDGYALSRIDANLYDADNATRLRTLGSKALSGTTATGSFALPVGLDDGTYTVRATLKDVAGNTRTDTFRFTVDSVRPTLELTGPSVVRPATPGEVTFEAADGIAVSFIGANLYDADNGTMIDALGSKDLSGTPATGSFALPTGLADGAYTVRATVVDAAGNTQTASHRVVVDSVRPTLTIDGPAEDSTLKVGDLGDVTLTATDANGLNRIAANLYDGDNRVLVAPIGSATPESSSWTGSWALPAGLDAGEYTIRASVIDVAGNSQTVTTPIVVVDGEASVAPGDGDQSVTPDVPATPVTPAEPVESDESNTPAVNAGPSEHAKDVTTDNTDASTETASNADAAGTAAEHASDSAPEAAASTKAQDAQAETESGPSNWWIAVIAGIGSMFAGLFVKRRLSH